MRHPWLWLKKVMTVVGVVIKSSRDLWPVVALMLLMCFAFTVLGMQLFGAVLNPDLEAYAEKPYAFKTRFDTFFWSFVQVEYLAYAQGVISGCAFLSAMLPWPRTKRCLRGVRV